MAGGTHTTSRIQVEGKKVVDKVVPRVRAMLKVLEQPKGKHKESPSKPIGITSLRERKPSNATVLAEKLGEVLAAVG